MNRIGYTLTTTCLCDSRTRFSGEKSVTVVAQNGRANRIPLTPALSQRERENARQSIDEASHSVISGWRTLLFPLPLGEGQGEGDLILVRVRFGRACVYPFYAKQN